MPLRTRRQDGQIIVLIALVLAMAASAIIGVYIARFGNLTTVTQLKQKQAYVDTAAESLRQWYIGNPVAMDQTAMPAVPGCVGAPAACLLAAADVNPLYGVQLDIGARTYAVQGYPWRMLTVWIPNPSARGAARTVFAAANALVSASVDGEPIQRVNQLAAQQAVDSLAISLQQGFGAWLKNYHNTLRDWFQPAGCGPLGANPALGCAQTWTAASALNTSAAAGWNGPANGPWGGAIEICNASACGAQDQGIPFDLGVRLLTPWGTTLERIAVEPLQAG